MHALFVCLAVFPLIWMIRKINMRLVDSMDIHLAKFVEYI